MVPCNHDEKSFDKLRKLNAADSIKYSTSGGVTSSSNEQYVTNYGSVHISNADSPYILAACEFVARGWNFEWTRDGASLSRGHERVELPIINGLPRMPVQEALHIMNEECPRNSYLTETNHTYLTKIASKTTHASVCGAEVISEIMKKTIR